MGSLRNNRALWIAIVAGIVGWGTLTQINAQAPNASSENSESKHGRNPRDNSYGRGFDHGGEEGMPWQPFAGCGCPLCEHVRHMHHAHFAGLRSEMHRPFFRHDEDENDEASPGEMFLEIDASEDGKITREELLAQFDRIDADKNGEVTRQELHEHLQKLHQENEQAELEEEAEEEFDDLLDEHDKNKDEKLSRDESPRRLWRQISAADKNEDGGITADEFKAFHCAQMQAHGPEHGHAKSTETKPSSSTSSKSSPANSSETRSRPQSGTNR